MNAIKQKFAASVADRKQKMSSAKMGQPETAWGTGAIYAWRKLLRRLVKKMAKTYVNEKMSYSSRHPHPRS